jgi:transposase-like protein
MLKVSCFVSAMVFRKYSRDVKLVAVKMALCGLNLGHINKQLNLSISHNSLQRWQLLYQRTLDVVRNPTLYGRQGRPVKVSREG